MAGIPWTAVASTGAVDEESIYTRRYAVGESPGPPATPDSSLRFHESSQDTGRTRVIVARYNVTAIPDQNTPIPSWTTFELGAVAPAGSRVVAELFQVIPCNGEGKALVGVVIQNSDGSRCESHALPSSLDFSQFLYHVRVTIERDTVAARPQAFTLRLF
jgi:hypothetical protein